MQFPMVFLDGPWRLAMGLNRLAAADWLVFDADAPSEIALKRRLLADRPGDVLALLPEASAAAGELLRLLIAHLPAHHPEHFAAEGTGLIVRSTGERVAADAPQPLRAAGLLVQEDLCLLAADGGTSYALKGASLSFPSRWRLAEKLGRPMGAIHAPVPEFAQRLSAPADRFMAALEPGRLVWRANWSLTDVPDLFQPDTRSKRIVLAEEDAGDRLWLRVERQTLRRLAQSRYIVFTIRTFVRPLTEAVREPGVAAALAARLREMPEPMLRYKNLAELRRPLLVWLEARGGCAQERAAVCG